MVTTEFKYTLPVVLGIMSNRQKIQEAVYYSGGVAQVDMLIDLDSIIEQAKLTEKQMLVTKLYYFEQCTQEEVAKVMNISQQAVLDHLQKIKFKIGKVVERWNKYD